MFCTPGVTRTLNTLLGGSAGGVDVGEGVTDDVAVEVSVKLVMVVLLLDVVEVDGGMAVTSLAQLLLVGPAHEKTPNEKGIAYSHKHMLSLHMHRLLN